jgi:PAS domain S-box-containing protein
MTGEGPLLWFGRPPPVERVAGRDVVAPPVDDRGETLAATASHDPAGVVYAMEAPGRFLESLRARHPDLPAVVLADPADCEAALQDPDADVVRPEAAAAEGAGARLRAMLSREGDPSTPVETLARYETIVEAVGDGVYALDADYRYVMANDALCSMTGYDRDQLLGADVSLVLTGDDLDDGVDARERARADPGTVQAVELELEPADGTTVPVENRFAAVVVDGAFAGTVGVVRDITERRAREAELRRKTESMEAFASLVGHDLRNPLSVADGYLEQAAADVDHPALSDVRAALDRMDDIVADLLLLARGEAAVEPAAVDLTEVARRAWRHVPADDAALSVAADRRLYASEGHLRSLLENLFRNAVEHGGDAVAVTVGALDDGFHVADDGVGFPDDVRDQAFEHGVAGGGGTGLGLAIVERIADAHGWSVTACESETGGARVEVRGVEWV